MPLRLIELYLPASRADQVASALQEHRIAGVWDLPAGEGRTLVRVLLRTEEVEPILDLLESHFGDAEGFRLILFSAEATIPRLELPEEKQEHAEQEEGQEEEEAPHPSRISREELYSKATDMAALTAVYVTMVALSTVVAAIGMLRDDVAVVIGAMLIAPLLGPNMALSLSTTLGDLSLAREALKANAAGLVLALVLSGLLGLLFGANPAVGQIASRTHINLTDFSLALASGSAGALAFTTGIATILVGVMVAVALLPPVVATGLLLGAGHTGLALQAFLLMLTNIICVNLSGVTTFLVQGVRPRTWWEADRARKATRIALALWAILLAALVGIILYART